MRLLLALLLPVAVIADGGAVLLRKHSRPLVITVFATPVPLRPGPADFTVLVQDEAAAPLLNRDVRLTLSKSGATLSGRAVLGQASNRLLYAASLTIPNAGDWHLTAVVDGRQVTGEIEVDPAQSPLIAYWPYFAIPPAAIALFALNQRLKSQRSRLE